MGAVHMQLMDEPPGTGRAHGGREEQDRAGNGGVGDAVETGADDPSRTDIDVAQEGVSDGVG